MSLDPGAQSSAGVLITIGRVYEEVTATRRDIGTLTGNVTRALEQGADHESRIRTIEHEGATTEDLKEVKDDLGPRVRALERWRWGVGGVVTAVSVGGSALVTYLTKH